MSASECPECGKRLYLTDTSANRVLAEMKEQGRVVTGRVYKAHGGFHITTKPLGSPHGTLADNPRLIEIARELRRKEAG